MAFFFSYKLVREIKLTTRFVNYSSHGQPNLFCQNSKLQFRSPSSHSSPASLRHAIITKVLATNIVRLSSFLKSTLFVSF